MGDWLRSRLARIAGPRLAGPLVPVVAVVAAFLVGGVMLLMLGANPIEGYGVVVTEGAQLHELGQAFGHGRHRTQVVLGDE